MTLTSEQVSRFVGGQAEIQNDSEGYIFRGEIETIAVVDDDLVMRFAWLAKGEGYPPIPRRWVEDKTVDYKASLMSTRPQPSRTPEGTERLIIQFPFSGELVLLVPPEAERKLDKSKVVTPEKDALRGRLAAQQHEIWASWMLHLFSLGEENADGSITIAASPVKAWKRRTETDYANLTETEREDTLLAADKILAILDEPKQ